MCMTCRVTFDDTSIVADILIQDKDLAEDGSLLEIVS
jgi:hypothetical protein